MRCGRLMTANSDSSSETEQQNPQPFIECTAACHNLKAKQMLLGFITVWKCSIIVPVSAIVAVAAVAVARINLRQLCYCSATCSKRPTAVWIHDCTLAHPAAAATASLSVSGFPQSLPHQLLLVLIVSVAVAAVVAVCHRNNPKLPHKTASSQETTSITQRLQKIMYPQR